MSKQPLDYQGVTGGENPQPQSPRVRWQTIVSFSLLGMGLACGIAALAWPPRRPQLIAAAVSLGITGVIIYFPYVRT